MSARMLTTADATLDAGEYAYTWYPRAIRGATKFGAMLCHGALGPDHFASSITWPSSRRLAWALARGSAPAAGGKGIPCAAAFLNGDKYANDTVMSRIDLMRTSLATRTGCSSTKLHMFGISMGGAAATRFAAANPTKVASVNVVIPAASLIKLAQQNPGQPIAGGYAAQLASAWGTSFTVLTVTLTNGSAAMVATAGSFTAAMASGSYFVVKNTGVRGSFDTTVPIGTTVASFTDATHATMSAAFTGTTGSYTIGVAQPLPSGADLLTLAPAIATAGIPFRAFYSSVDPYIDAADVQALATAAGGTSVAIDSTSGHADGTLATLASYNSGTNFADLAAHMITNGA